MFGQAQIRLQRLEGVKRLKALQSVSRKSPHNFKTQHFISGFCCLPEKIFWENCCIHQIVARNIFKAAAEYMLLHFRRTVTFSLPVFSGLAGASEIAEKSR